MRPTLNLQDELLDKAHSLTCRQLGLDRSLSLGPA